MGTCVSFKRMKIAVVIAAIIGTLANNTLEKFDMKTICETATQRRECPPMSCNWCKSLVSNSGVAFADDEKEGCKSKTAAKELQATGRYYCNVDPLAYVCQDKPQNICESNPDCSWCQHPALGNEKGRCYANKQAILIQPKGICTKGDAKLARA
eukprot:GDKK01036444.1.p2 GENE.GDKK01036444.1~~GDKK01036444.1.p2  ORF type:complete len:154 (+),score=29.89 GDKK01036444.1:3-464(+)